MRTHLGTLVPAHDLLRLLPGLRNATKLPPANGRLGILQKVVACDALDEERLCELVYWQGVCMVSS